MTTFAKGADFFARSTKVSCTTATSQSTGILSTEVLITVKSGRTPFKRFLNLVAPIALDPIPASHANTILRTKETSNKASLLPLLSAFIDCIFLLASSKFFSPASLTIGLATKNETPAAIKTPNAVMNTEPFSAIDKKAIIEPGLDGPFNPILKIE